ncbi:MAG: hypothetical protein KF898_05245 [Parachlamydiales bacterium]|nr:hypothetical protein [Verrucomicrobiota bacterium]MBX3719034.1 hypothetical protein [Candidatus Acheromyda pituitae]
MNDSFRQLVHDALNYARAQPQQAWIFASAEEVQFFQSCSRQHSARRELPQPTASKPIPVKTQIKEGVAKPQLEPKASLPSPSKETPAAAKESAISPQPALKMPAPPAIKPSEEIVKTLRKIAPALHISDQVPDDHTAKQISSAWKEKLSGIDVVLIALNNIPDTIELMKNLAKAIQKDLRNVKLMSGDRLEQEKRWDAFFQTNTFRLIIASSGMEQYPELLKHYKALPAQQSAFLADIPLIVLEHPSAYTESPNKKVSLWKSLCLMLKR